MMDEQEKPKKRRGVYGQGYVYQRKDSPYLWIRFSLRGKPQSESTHETSKAKAQRFLKFRIAQVGADKIGAKPFYGPQAEKIRMKELLDDLETNYRARGKFGASQEWRKKRAVEFFGNMFVKDVNLSTFDAFKATAKVRGGKRDMNEGTENGILQWAGQAHDLGRKNGKHAFPRIEWKRNSIKKFRRTGDGDEKKVRAVAEYLTQTGEEVRADFVLACYVGFWRPEAVAALKVGDITTDANGIATKIFFSAADDKEEYARDVHIAGELARVITKQLARAGTDKTALLFSRNYLGKTFPISQFSKWFRRAWSKCGFDLSLNGRPVTFYHLRHWGVSRALENGMTIKAAMVCGGWTSPTVLLAIYAKVAPKQMQQNFLDVEKNVADQVAKAEAGQNTPKERVQ
jgi:integrase